MSISALSPVPAIIEYGDDDSSDDGSWFTILDEFSDFQLSIESAKLRISSTGGGDRRIYGDIHIGGCTYGKAFTVYHRSADEAETVSPGVETDLTLCGPRYSVYAKEPEFLYVDLHRVDGTPLLRERVSFDRTLANPNSPWEMSAIGQDCSLTVHMTAFAPSFMTRITVSPSYVPDNCLVFVSGTITAVQTTLDNGEIRRTVPLLRRPESDPIRLNDSHIIIPLDRNVVVCPIEADRDLAQRAYDLTLSHGVTPIHTPDDPVHGKGSSLAIHVDLQVWIEAGGDPPPVPFRGTLQFNLLGSHPVGLQYTGDVVATATKRKCKVQHSFGAVKRKPRLKRSNLEEPKSMTIADVSDNLTFKVLLTTFQKYSCGNFDDEVHERKLPLYQPKKHHTSALMVEDV